MGVPLLGVPGIPLDWFMYGDDIFSPLPGMFQNPNFIGDSMSPLHWSVELVACFPNFPMIWWWLRGITQILIGSDDSEVNFREPLNR